MLITLIELISGQKNDMVPGGYYKNLWKVNTCSDHKVRLVSVHTCVIFLIHCDFDVFFIINATYLEEP